jgi:hypothetical protein
MHSDRGCAIAMSRLFRETRLNNFQRRPPDIMSLFIAYLLQWPIVACGVVYSLYCDVGVNEALLVLDDW